MFNLHEEDVIFDQEEEEKFEEQAFVWSVAHELIEQLFKMEAALMEHDRKAWEVALTDMEKARTRGHKQFKPKRNRRGGGQRGNGDK